MVIINHEPLIKTFGNGFQITFPNKYTVIAKNGIGARCVQTKSSEDTAELIMASRFGGNSGPDVEVEIYDINRKNISDKFGGDHSLEHISPMELVNLLYIVSSLK